MELLKLFDRNLSDEDLLEIKLLLAKHFLEKSMDAADKVVQKNNWSPADLVRFSKEHHHTLYKSDAT